MTFYRQYRPQKIEELDLVSARNAISAYIGKDFPQSVLFSGPRGTGKTSAARIVAKGLLCEKNNGVFSEPCNECETCRSITDGNFVDVVEIDAASHRGIDDIRSLRSEIMLSPLSAKRKIYIIDEVHMLTTEAANALLKTLEEPPAHVVFLLATTDPQKLPATVLSRLIKIPFHKATAQEVEGRIKKVAEKEGIEIDAGAISLIYSLSGGGFRDAVRILEEVSSGSKKITEEVVRQRSSLASDDLPTSLVDSLISSDASAAFEILNKIEVASVDIKNVISSCIGILHKKLVNGGGGRVLFVLDCFLSGQSTMWYAPYPAATLASIIAHAVSEVGSPTASKKIDGAESTVRPTTPIQKEEERVDTKTASVKVETETVVEAKVVESNIESKVVEDIPSVSSEDRVVDDALWQQVVNGIKGKNPTVEALLKASRPITVKKDSVEIGVFYEFHKDRLEHAPNKQALVDVICEAFGTSPKVSFVLDSSGRPPIAEFTLTSSDSPAIIKAAKDIFAN